MNNILFIGNGFDIDHCMKTEDIKGISTYRNLKKEIKNENKDIYMKINSAKDIEHNWGNLEKIIYNLGEEETEEFLKIVRCWAEKIDVKYNAYKQQLVNHNFQNFINSNNLLILSLNYTNLIEIVYNIKNQKLLKLHDFRELAYLDSNDTYDTSQKEQATFGVPTTSNIHNSSKQAVGIPILRTYLCDYLFKDSETINIYTYGLSLDGSDFKYFEEIFKHDNCKYINEFNIYVKKHDEVEKDKDKIKKNIEKFFDYRSVQNKGIVHLMKKELNLSASEEDENWVIINYKLRERSFS